ncbi:hypothetical protein APSETT444_000380 [Aspergillus pseudonomiae]
MPNTLGNGEWLEVGQSLWSQNGETELKMQEDGKIAVYVNGECVFQNTEEQSDNNNTPLWHTDSTGSSDPSSVVCAVQNDGNVVLYTGQAIWATNTGR